MKDVQQSLEPRALEPRASEARAPERLIVGISGASGIVYGIEALRQLRELGAETHLVMSKSAILTLSHECELGYAEVCALASRHYQNNDIGAVIASGTFRTRGMLVAPCSIRSLSEIATGVTGSLLSRAADVVLKERRRLVLMVRETPLHAGHLQSMLNVTQMGAIVAPPVPAFYPKPEHIDDIVRQSVGRALELFGFEAKIHRWGEEE
ncbi:MAG: UbiX family flavin prenyltransferase [Pseudomonadales bacterium]|jgi:4-hydroxy-3-polyprenylbenzoate decarboxylase|nr:UbiX family flavin prenyltransferase [Pseudomonadales bacterium]